MRIRIKQIVATLIANNFTGFLISKIWKSVRINGGVRIKISSKYISNTIKAYLFWGMYESAENRSIQKFLKTNYPVIELGASLGVITCLIHKYNPPVHIALEANPFMIPLIKENLIFNKLTEPNIINKAISYSGKSTVKFRLSQDNTGSSISAVSEINDSTTIIDVETTTLSEIVTTNHIEKYILISDIEGAECLIFENDFELIRDECIMMIIELHESELFGKKCTIEQICDFIVDKLNFKLISIDGAVYVFEK